MLSLHDRNQFLSDVIQLVTSEQVGDLAARQHVVHVFCRGEQRSVEVQNVLKRIKPGRCLQSFKDIQGFQRMTLMILLTS